MRIVRRGDTLVEVAFSIAIFALVCIFAIALMNNGVSTAQASMEISMTRNEIDAQAEALRFIQNSFLSERELVVKEYAPLWNAIKSLAINPSEIDKLSSTPDACSDLYKANTVFSNNAFIINTRKINPADVNGTVIRFNTGKFAETALYPRIIFRRSGASSSNNNSDELVERGYYDQVDRVEGFGVIAVKGDDSDAPEFYDFHIRTCWYAPGRVVPSTINTIVRLYNPEFQ